MLQSIPYHQKVKEHFKSQTKTWDFFFNVKNKEGQLEQFKQELLKSTYKFDETSDTYIFEKINKAKEVLNLQDLPVYAYQAQNTDELNASIIYLKGEAHIVFSGPITKILNEEELLAVLAHELTHVKLFSMLDGNLEVADRIITSIANNYNSEPAYFETARIFRLYTEIFCDRGAYTVLKDIDPVISSLVKASTGLEKLNAESYLKQADEIFAAEKDLSTAGISHPENFIRAKAIQLYHEKGNDADNEIAKLIEGLSNLDHLDIFKQRDLTKITKEFLQLFLKPKWFQSSIVLAQAKQYFTDFAGNEKITLLPEFTEYIEKSHQSVKDYLSYVLLDFIWIDPSLEDIPTGWAYQFAEDVHLKETLDACIKKELKLSEKKLAAHKKKSMEAYHEAKENDSEQIYEA